MKRIVCLLLALWLCAACALTEPGEAARITLRFDEGFSLSLPKGWVSYSVPEPSIRYALGSGDGSRYLYILARPAAYDSFEALWDAVARRERCETTGQLDLDGQAFTAFIAADLNASGCATLLNGEQVVFLFTPQDDSDYMLTVAEIMASFRLRQA